MQRTSNTRAVCFGFCAACTVAPNNIIIIIMPHACRKDSRPFLKCSDSRIVTGSTQKAHLLVDGEAVDPSEGALDGRVSACVKCAVIQVKNDRMQLLSHVHAHIHT